MVPKSRLDEVLAKQKALEKQLDELRAQKQEPGEAPEAYDFDAKEVEYQNLVLDGEAQKAAALRKEIRAAERAQLRVRNRVKNRRIRVSKPASHCFAAGCIGIRGTISRFLTGIPINTTKSTRRKSSICAMRSL